VNGVVLWDFDGTLAHRPGMWGGCMVEVLDEHDAGHAVTVDVLRPFLRDGFPWHAPHVAHPDLCEADAWWTHVGALLARAYERSGYKPVRAAELSRLARLRYVDSTRWVVFDDTLPALERLRARGWRHVLLSNHVPELPELVRVLGLADQFDAVLTSAATGFEKPHAEAFALALRAAGNPKVAWMIGDNYEADVAGAEAVGLPAVLVRRRDPRAERSIASLDELDALLGEC
jgi:putative hydrolase of the HAD superfamily